jgi:hypothetical protein
VLRYQSVEVTAAHKAGEQKETGYHLDRYTLDLGEVWTLPTVDINASADTRGVLVVTADRGSAATAQVAYDALIHGKRVIALDVLFHGECKTQPVPPHQFAMMTSAAGSRTLGIQVAQLAAVYRWVLSYTRTTGLTVAGIGPVSSIVTLMAASLAEVRIDRVVTVETLASLKQLFETPISYEDCPSLFCFGLLEFFDIRELIGLLAPIPIDISRPQADRVRVNAEWMRLRDLYARFGVMGFQPWQDALRF